ncbi:MAG: hypothetical protein IPO13_03935 [Rhodocyclaceae bacterium]|nr:hypothetical protein [Rhodocyclaceae bacterium]
MTDQDPKKIILAKVARAGAQVALSACLAACLAIYLNGCMSAVLIGKSLQNMGPSDPVNVQIYQERQNQISRLTKEFKAKCLERAAERIDRTLEGVLVLKRIDLPANSPMSFGGNSGSFIHPHYMFSRLGLTSLEVETDNRNNRPAKGFIYIDLSKGVYSIRKESTPDATVVFENIGDPEEAKVGFYGRRLSVVDAKTQEVIATRTEFLGPGLSCPSAPDASPDYKWFLSRVINPVTYGCLFKTQSITSSSAKWSAIDACEHSYWEKYGKSDGSYKKEQGIVPEP